MLACRQMAQGPRLERRAGACSRIVHAVSPDRRRLLLAPRRVARRCRATRGPCFGFGRRFAASLALRANEPAPKSRARSSCFVRLGWRRGGAPARPSGDAGTLELRLPAREPIDRSGLFRFFADHAIRGLEEGDDSRFARPLALPGGRAELAGLVEMHG